MKTEALMCLLLVVVGFISGYSYAKYCISEERNVLISNAKALEDYYHEQISKLPACVYDPTFYNSLLK